MVLDLLTSEVRLLRVENLATTLENLEFTLSTACLTTTSRWKVDTVLVEGSHNGTTLIHGQFGIAVYGQCYLTAWAEIFLCYQQYYYKYEDNHEEYPYAE